MSKVIINGLWAGTKVVIFLESTFGTHNALRLFEDYSSSSLVEGFIDDKYTGKEVRIACLHEGFNFDYSKHRLEEIGLFYTVNIQKGNAYVGGIQDDPSYIKFNVREHYLTSQKEMQDIVRKTRYKNGFIKYIAAFLEASSLLVCL